MPGFTRFGVRPSNWELNGRLFRLPLVDLHLACSMDNLACPVQPQASVRGLHGEHWSGKQATILWLRSATVVHSSE